MMRDLHFLVASDEAPILCPELGQVDFGDGAGCPASIRQCLRSTPKLPRWAARYRKLSPAPSSPSRPGSWQIDRKDRRS